MDTSFAVRAFAALAQESRVGVVRLLARQGDGGLGAGEIAARLRLAPSTLSFHLNQLVHAGLCAVRRSGRAMIYSLRADAVRELFFWLGEDCCQGRSDLCATPTARIEAHRRDAAAPAGRQRVLFVCTRNSARSQLAEAILRHEAGDRFEVCSAGVVPQPIHPLTLRVLAEAGIPTADLRSQDLGDHLGKVAIHHAIVVCEAANADCPRIHPFALHQHYWPFPDPVAVTGTPARRLAAFREARDAIRARIRRWLRHELPRQARSTPTGTTKPPAGRARKVAR